MYHLLGTYVRIFSCTQSGALCLNCCINDRRLFCVLLRTDAMWLDESQVVCRFFIPKKNVCLTQNQLRRKNVLAVHYTESLIKKWLEFFVSPYRLCKCWCSPVGCTCIAVQSESRGSRARPSKISGQYGGIFVYRSIIGRVCSCTWNMGCRSIQKLIDLSGVGKMYEIRNVMLPRFCIRMQCRSEVVRWALEVLMYPSWLMYQSRKYDMSVNYPDVYIEAIHWWC